MPADQLSAALPRSPGSVVIRRVETIPLRVPFASPFTIAAPDTPSRESVDVLIVRIHSSEGIVGVGETQAWRRQGSSEVLGNLAHLIETLFGPAMVGRSPFDIAAIMTKLDAIAYDSLYAQAAVGDALYDLVGKLLGLPVYALLGGRCVDRIPVGIALSIGAKPGAMLEQAQQAYEKGYRHLRLKIGLDPVKDIENARSMRSHFGDKVILRADANGGMAFDQALSLLSRLEEYDLEYVEQPIPGWDLDGMAALARMVRTPLSADESLTTDHSMVKIVQQRAASIIQTKTGKNGGIHRSRNLWAIAHAAGVAVFPGNHPGTSVQTASVAHLCAAWPHRTLVGDFQMFATDEITRDIVTRPAVVKDGYLPLPEGPGLGIELNEAALKHLRID